MIFAADFTWGTTGLSAPIHDDIAGAAASQPKIATPDQHVCDSKPDGKRVAVIDHDAYHMGSAVAIDLAERGHEVTDLTHNESVGPYYRITLEEQQTHMKLMKLCVRLPPLQFALSTKAAR